MTLNVVGGQTSLLVGFVASLLLARWLGPADRGLLGLMYSAIGVGVSVVGLGFPLAVMYYGSLRDTPGGVLLGTSAAFCALLAAVLVPLAWWFQQPLADLVARGRGGGTWVLVAALVPLTVLDWTTHNQLLGQLRFGLYNSLVVLSKVAALGVVVVLVGVLDLGVLGGVLAMAATSLVMVVGSLPPLLAAERPRPALQWFRTLVSYGARVQMGSIFQTLNFRLDLFVLQAFRPLDGVGQYAVAQIFAELVTTLASAFQSSIIPLVAGGDELSRDRTTIASMRHHGILAVGAIALDAVFGTLVILYGFGDAYRGAIVPMLILLPAMWFMGTGAVVASDLRGRGRPGLTSALSGVTLVVTIALDLALIPPFGVTGAAIASAIAYAIYGAISAVAIARVTSLPLRTLLVPTREDLAAYPRAVRAVTARLRRR